MVTNRRSAVDVQIAVMDLMKAPQQRHGVREPVLRVVGEVERNDSKDDRQPRRQCNTVQQTPAALFRQHRQRDTGKRQAQPYGNRPECDEHDLVEPAGPGGHGKGAPRQERLPDRDDAQARQ